MPFTTALGALLGGATEEAGKIHQERYQQEQADRKFTMDMITGLVDNPAVPNTIREEAWQEAHGRILSTMFPDQFNHKPGKLGKLVDQFVGMQNPRGPMSPMTTVGAGGPQQFGTGTGNAKGQLGTLPPPQQAMPKDLSSGQMSDGSPMPPAQQPAAGSGGMLSGLQPPAQALGTTTASGFMDPYAQARLSAYHEAQVDEAKHQVASKYAEQEAEATAKGGVKGKQVTLGFDIGPFKAGAKVDPEILPLIDTVIKSTMPEAETTTRLTMDGDKELTLIDKNPRSSTFGKVLSTVNTGPTLEAVRSGLTETFKAFERDNNRRPTMAESMKIGQDYEKGLAAAKMPITIDIGKALIDAREAAQKDLYGANDPETINDTVDEIMEGRTQITQVASAGGLRSAVTRAFADRIASGEKAPIPLTPAGSTTIAQTAPVLQMVQRLKTAIATFKDSNIPLSEALQRQLYSMGISTDQSGTIAQAELLKVVGAGRIMRGVTRNMAALELAMQHLPNVRVDSGKLMYEKLENLETNLRDVVGAAYKYERKGGAPAPDTSTSGTAAPKQSYKDWLATQPK